MRRTLLPGLSTGRLLAAVLLTGRPVPARFQQLLFRQLLEKRAQKVALARRHISQAGQSCPVTSLVPI